MTSEKIMPTTLQLAEAFGGYWEPSGDGRFSVILPKDAGEHFMAFLMEHGLHYRQGEPLADGMELRIETSIDRVLTTAKREHFKPLSSAYPSSPDNPINRYETTPEGVTMPGFKTDISGEELPTMLKRVAERLMHEQNRDIACMFLGTDTHPKFGKGLNLGLGLGRWQFKPALHGFERPVSDVAEIALREIITEEKKLDPSQFITKECDGKKTLFITEKNALALPGFKTFYDQYQKSANPAMGY